MGMGCAGFKWEKPAIQVQARCTSVGDVPMQTVSQPRTPPALWADSVSGTHLLTDSDGSDSCATSGFLNIFARDLDPEGQAPTFHDTPQEEEEQHTANDNVMSSRVGASEEDDSASEHES